MGAPVARAGDLDHAVYTVQEYRSATGGEGWSKAVKVLAGRRGEHLEDTRSTVLEDGSVLLAYEIETAEAFGRPVDETPIRGRSRELLEECLVFENRDEIERVVFISGPHRGSELARLFLYIRSHWLRMPPWLLARHLARKAIRRCFAKPKE